MDSVYIGKQRSIYSGIAIQQASQGLINIEKVICAFYDDFPDTHKCKDTPLKAQAAALVHEVGKMYRTLGMIYQ